MAEAWDREQRNVIEADPECRLLVDAGPGNGKTAVACARIAHLIQCHQVEAVNVLLISFTRTAVAELRNRIEGYIGDAARASSIRIATIDSTVWTLLNGYDLGAASLFGGYDSNIDQLCESLRRGDDDLLEHLEKYQHVVIDEAQDILGTRADLIVLLIARLAEECGVTVFADPCQAIYGFTGEDGESSDSSQSSLVERVVASSDFKRQTLRQIHRTSEAHLVRLLKVMRPAVARCESGEKSQYLQFRDLLTANAPPLLLDRRQLVKNIKGLEEYLVLYRTRAEALLTSSMLCSSGVSHRFRMSGLPVWLQPWIGVIFRDFSRPKIDWEEFEDCWMERGCDELPGTPSLEDAWERSMRIAGQGGNLRVELLRRSLSRSRPPEEFTCLDNGFAGPTIGTIHASKGREADHVLLYLPPASDSETTCWAEECRVLYVGATRGRKTVHVGQGGSTYSSILDGTGRPFRKKVQERSFQFEVGREGDFDVISPVSSRLQDRETAAAIQNYLIDTAGEFGEHTADSSIASNWAYRLHLEIDADDHPFVEMTPAFMREVFSMARLVHGNSPKRIPHIWQIGTRTVVLPVDSPLCSQLVPPHDRTGIFLVPVLRAWTKSFARGNHR